MKYGIPLICTALLVLAACMKPTTVQPHYTQAELKREQQAQAAAAKNAQADVDEGKAYTQTEIEQLATRLTPIATRVAQAASTLCRDMRGARAQCQYAVLLDAKKKGLNAHADGKNVVLNPAMVDFARNDAHLAFVIAHEFAHNIMGHLKAQQQNIAVGGILGTLADAAASSQGLETGGALGKIGAQQGLLKYSPDFEAEADYVGLYILARTGYPIEDAPNFWRMMSQAEPRSIYVTSTHPNNPSRTIEMEKTVVEIRTKKQAGKPLLPNIRPRA